jgi:uncharacterized alpha-E superfamily protein
MLSRLADSLFWMTRYVERTDGILRMLKINFITSLDQTSQANFSWQPVLKIFTNLDKATVEQMSHNGDDVLRYMIMNKDNTNSVRNIIAHARENARGMQDHLTKEVWECLNEFYHKVNSKSIEKSIKNGEQIVMLEDLISHCLLYYGVAEVTMPRGMGWNFMNLGKLIERSVQTVDILDVKFGNIDFDLKNPVDVLYWRNVLLSLSGYELYLKTYRSGLETHNIADLAVLNTNFPRSVLYCLKRLTTIVDNLTKSDPERGDHLIKLMGRLKAKVEYSDIDSMSEMGFHEYLIDIKKDIYGFSNALAERYFAYNYY